MEIKDSHISNFQEGLSLDHSSEKQKTSSKQTSPSASIHATILDVSSAELVGVEKVSRKFLGLEEPSQKGRIVGDLISIEHSSDLHNIQSISQTVVSAQQEVEKKKQKKEIQEDVGQYTLTVKEEREDEALEEINIEEVQEKETGEDLVQKRIDDEEKGKAPFNPSPKPL